MEEKKEIDISYSGLCNEIDGDLSVGRKLIIEMSKDFLSYSEQIEELKHNLLLAEAKMSYMKEGVKNAMQHLKLKYPLAVIMDKGLIVISEKTISLETNLI